MCWHAHENRDLRQMLQRRGGVEFRHQQHPRSGRKHRVDGGEQSVHVKQRQHVQQHVLAGEVPCFGKHRRRWMPDWRASASRPSIGPSCPRYTRSPPAIARRGRGTTSDRDRPCARTARGTLARPLRASRPALRRRGLRKGCEQLPARQADDRDPRLRVTQQMINLVRRARDVDGHEYRPETQAGDIEQYGLHGFLDAYRDAVTGCTPQPVKAAANCADCSSNAA